MYLKLFLILYCTTLLSCQYLNPKIIGGQDAKTGQFPFSAVIYKKTELGTFFCGGALISNSWILTAGQCVSSAISFTIYLGSNSLNLNDTNRLVFETSTYELHPEFNSSTLDNDIGLVKLREPVFYNDYIQRVQIAYDYTADFTNVTGIGWGETSNSTGGLSNELQYVILYTVPISECQVVYGSQISDGILCVAGEYNEGACRGDSGSPLLHNDPVSQSIRHIGISSFISGRGCESTDPSGYTKTYFFRDWIQNKTSI